MLGSSPSEVILYHAPPSFYSQIVRLVLAEKGVHYEKRVALAGPPTFETYEPWYMRLNPGGTVPTLLMDGQSVSDSRDILREVDSRFEGRWMSFTDLADTAEMESWIERSYQLPERILAYGSTKFASLGKRVNSERRKSLLSQKEKSPELSELYDAKLADIDGFVREAAEPGELKKALALCEQTFDELEARLIDRKYICGEKYSLADVVWTVTIARQFMLEGSPLSGRPALSIWYASMKSRPSFRSADIWERLRPSRMLGIIWSKFRLQALMAITLLSLLIGWLLSLI